jgi:hypothetical protein
MQLLSSLGCGGAGGLVPARRPLMAPGWDVFPAVDVFRKQTSVNGARHPAQIDQAVQLA